MADRRAFLKAIAATALLASTARQGRRKRSRAGRPHRRRSRRDAAPDRLRCTARRGGRSDCGRVAAAHRSGAHTPGRTRGRCRRLPPVARPARHRRGRHLHARSLARADDHHGLRGRKDVYVEKPLTHVVREGEWMLDGGRRPPAHRAGRDAAALRRPLPARGDLVRQGHIGNVLHARIRATATSRPASPSRSTSRRSRRTPGISGSGPRRSCPSIPAGASTTSGGSGITPAARRPTCSRTTSTSSSGSPAPCRSGPSRSPSGSRSRGLEKRRIRSRPCTSFPGSWRPGPARRFPPAGAGGSRSRGPAARW